MAIRNKLIPNYFTAKEFCDLVDETRKINFTSKNFRTSVNQVFGNILSQKLKNTSYITFREVNQLIGSLFDMFKIKEEKESIEKDTNKEVVTTIDTPETKEIKYIRVLLKSTIGEIHYKEFVADFFKHIKEYENPLLEDTIDIIINLMKTYHVANTENNLTELVDYLERMRSIKGKKTEKSKKIVKK